MLSLPTAQSLDKLRLAYDAFHDQQVHSDAYQTLFFGYLASVAILVTFIVLRLWNKRRIRLLTTVNETLEKKGEISKELEKAYQELKWSQARLIQSEKMSALGQMVAGVAHEINTPLAYSRSNVALLQEQLAPIVMLVEETTRQAALLRAPEGDETTLRAQLTTVAELGKSLHEEGIVNEMGELLQASLSGLDQIAEMVLSLKDFSRLDRKRVDKVNLHDGLDSALRIAHNQLKHNVDVIKKYGDIPLVACAPSQINQVFLNMLVNASQAMDERGTIRLSTRTKGAYVEVSIEDNGKGIPENVLPHIFEPFFTTKDVGEGTGLGLAICYQIIEQHGGTISVQSKVGQGTCFTISLPVTQKDTSALEEMAA